MMLHQLQEQLVGLAELGLTVAASSSSFPQSFSIDLMVQALGSGEIENFNTVQELLENVLPAKEAVLLLPLLPLLQASKEMGPAAPPSSPAAASEPSAPNNRSSGASSTPMTNRGRSNTAAARLEELTFGTQVVDRAAVILKSKGLLREGEDISEYLSSMLQDWVLSAEHARVWLAFDFVVRTGSAPLLQGTDWAMVQIPRKTLLRGLLVARGVEDGLPPAPGGKVHRQLPAAAKSVLVSVLSADLLSDATGDSMTPASTPTNRTRPSLKLVSGLSRNAVTNAAVAASNHAAESVEEYLSPLSLLEVTECLHSSGLFNAIGAKTLLMQVAHRVRQRVLREGECVMREGAVAKNMFVIARGSLILHRGASINDGSGVRRVIGPGHCIGELGVMCGNGNENSEDGHEDEEEGEGGDEDVAMVDGQGVVTPRGRRHTMRGLHVSSGTAAEEGTVVLVVSSATFCEMLTTKPSFRRGVLKVMGAALINVIGGSKSDGGPDEGGMAGAEGAAGRAQNKTAGEGGGEGGGAGGGKGKEHWKDRLRVRTDSYTPPSTPARQAPAARQAQTALYFRFEEEKQAVTKSCSVLPPTAVAKTGLGKSSTLSQLNIPREISPLNIPREISPFNPDTRARSASNGVRALADRQPMGEFESEFNQAPEIAPEIDSPRSAQHKKERALSWDARYEMSLHCTIFAACYTCTLNTSPLSPHAIHPFKHSPNETKRNPIIPIQSSQSNKSDLSKRS
jgi:CRP-like cAMP-binding protein